MDRKGTIPTVLLFLRLVSRHGCGHYLLEMTGWKDILSGYCQLKLSNWTVCRPSWQKGVHSCSPWAGLPPVLLQHSPPFLAIEKLILRQNILRRQRKTALCAAFGDTGKKWWEGVILNCVHVSVYRESRERNKLIVHSVPLRFNPSPFLPLPSSISHSFKSQP